MIKANDDLTPEHHQFFLYQMLRGLKYIHTGADPGQLSGAFCLQYTLADCLLPCCSQGVSQRLETQEHIGQLRLQIEGRVAG